jgi:hypothetical protein
MGSCDSSSTGRNPHGSLNVNACLAIQWFAAKSARQAVQLVDCFFHDFASFGAVAALSFFTINFQDDDPAGELIKKLTEE